MSAAKSDRFAPPVQDELPPLTKDEKNEYKQWTKDTLFRKFLILRRENEELQKQLAVDAVRAKIVRAE
jgi:hypothetical protein